MSFANSQTHGDLIGFSFAFYLFMQKCRDESVCFIPGPDYQRYLNGDVELVAHLMRLEREMQEEIAAVRSRIDDDLAVDNSSGPPGGSDHEPLPSNERPRQSLEDGA